MREPRAKRAPHGQQRGKRPYSWTGCYDDIIPSITSPQPDDTPSITRHKLLSSNDPTSYFYNEPDPRDTSVGEAHSFQSSSSALLTDRLQAPPLYLKWDTQQQKIVPVNMEELRPPGFTQPPPSARKKSKLPKRQRGSPSLVRSEDDFEYFSLSEPPAGLARPVEIFPPRDNLAPSSIRRRKEGDKCRDCMTRIPYATLIATIMCVVGVGVFCGTMYRGTTLTVKMFDEVFKIQITWDRKFRMDPIQMTFMIVGAAMGGLGLMILFLGCLSTGSTRSKVYKTWRGRVGGRISCAIFMGITYILAIVWLLILCSLVIATLFYTIAYFQCRYIPKEECIDYNQLSFLFPEGTPEEDKRVCGEYEWKTFCKDCVNNAEIMFILASISAFLVVLSLINYLMCLSANYAHIKDQEKFMDLQEIQFLQESEMSTLPKDRF